jgi:hypothetical protein
MKKLMLLLFVILLVGTVSSFEFDNIKNYDEETNTIDIRNSILGIPFLQLGKIAEIQLNTPTNYLVPIGYQKVAEFEVNTFTDYDIAFKELELYDKKDGNKKFTRDYDYKYKTIEQVPDYKTICDENLSENGTVEYSNCRQEQIGLKDKVVWKDLGLSDFKDKEVKTIGIFTNVERDDVVEWIPNFFGVRINEWAIWTASLNVQIVGYWKLDETSGTNAEDSTGNGFNLTASNGILSGDTGIINNSADFTGGVWHMVNSTTSNAPGTSGGTWTLSMWLNGSTTSFQFVIDNRPLGLFGMDVILDANFRIVDDGNNNHNLIAGSSVMNGTWNHVVITLNGTALEFYFNGVSTTNASITSSDWKSSTAFVFGGVAPAGGNGAVDYEGWMDEIGIWNRTLSSVEVTQLYNEGVGITFTDLFDPIITLNAPVDTFNSSSPNITFNATVTDEVAVQSVTLFIDGVLNETNSSGISGDYIFNKTLSESNHNWSIGAIDTDNNTANSSVRTFTVDTLNPSVIINSPIGRQSNIKIGDNETVTWNITDASLDTCLLDYNGINTTLNCSVNTTSFLYVDGVNNLSIFANDSFGRTNTTTTSWDYNIIQVNQSFDSPVFTTSAQTFSVNITINSEFTDAPTAPSLIYNGTTTAGGTVTSIGGDNYTLSQTIDIPDLVNGTSDWLFSFTLNSSLFNSSTSQQTTFRLILTNCDTPSFINFTFKNETLAEEDITATFDSVWGYFLGSGDVTRTLSFSNASENSFYGFCLNAANDTLFTQVNVSYTNSISQQRQFRPTLLTLTNATTNQVLYLLPTVDGLFNTFRTEDTLGNTIVGARGTITRTLGGSTITSAIDITDGSGLVIFFLDPDITYTASFSATGFADNVFTFVPTTDLRTVIMGSVVPPAAGSNISLGMNYTIEPTNTTLNNGTDITFRFIVSSTETITFMGFNISNGTATLLLVNQTGDGTISGILNTRNNNTFTGVFTISTVNETVIIVRIWEIEQGFIGDYSIFRQFTLFLDYGFEDFIRLLIVIATLAVVMIFMSREIGIDEEVKMAVAILIVWAFSIVGWLDTGIAINSTSANINSLSQFSNQYGIAIVSTVAAAYFILRRAFRQI